LRRYAIFSSVVEHYTFFGPVAHPHGYGVFCSMLCRKFIVGYAHSEYYRLATALSIMGVSGVTSHHVTTIFLGGYFCGSRNGFGGYGQRHMKGKNSIDEQLGLNFNLNNVISRAYPDLGLYQGISQRNLEQT
jgi:hypothetical protein